MAFLKELTWIQLEVGNLSAFSPSVSLIYIDYKSTFADLTDTNKNSHDEENKTVKMSC